MNETTIDNSEVATMDNKRSFTVIVPAELHLRLKYISAFFALTMREIINRAIEKEVTEMEKKYEEIKDDKLKRFKLGMEGMR